MQMTRPGTGTGGTAPRDRQDEGRRPRRWWPVVTPIAVLGIVVSLLLPGGRHQWALSLFRQRTPYTALAFSDASRLPSRVSGNEPVKFGFSIANQEGQPVDYQYVVSVIKGGHSHILGDATQIVAAGATWTVAASVKPACGSSQCTIEVSLPGHPEAIDFILQSQLSK